ncbi:MAG TPA: ABC transporter transmembrane domain-containing protein, partial [Chloroflexota bacterium]|nr:ABC transporter transmembrane domain-containing protein [Chloroflexota bacterium]
MTGTADVTTGLILWRWLRRHPVLAMLALLPFVLIYALALLTALLTRAVFDAAVAAPAATTVAGGTPHGPGLATLVTLLTVAHLASVAIGYGELLAQATSRHLLAGTLRYNLFAALLRRPGARALAAPVGEVVNRFRDDPAAVQALLVPICNVCSLGLFSAVALVIMLSISVPVTLGVCLPLLAVALIAGTAGPRAGRYYAATRTASGRVSAALGELFGAVAAIKVAGAEVRVLAQLRPLDAARRRVALRERVFVEVADSIYGDIATLGTGVVLLFAMQSMRAGTFTVGDLTLFTTLLGYTSTLTGSGGVLLGRWRTAGVALGRLAALLPEMTQETLAGPAPLALPIAGRRRAPPSPPAPAPA